MFLVISSSFSLCKDTIEGEFLHLSNPVHSVYSSVLNSESIINEIEIKGKYCKDFKTIAEHMI